VAATGSGALADSGCKGLARWVCWVGVGAGLCFPVLGQVGLLLTGWAAREGKDD
jgi:hypothetical protein